MTPASLGLTAQLGAVASFCVEDLRITGVGVSPADVVVDRSCEFVVSLVVGVRDYELA
jgi:hypothetical protein